MYLSIFQIPSSNYIYDMCMFYFYYEEKSSFVTLRFRLTCITGLCGSRSAAKYHSIDLQMYYQRSMVDLDSLKTREDTESAHSWLQF